MRTMKGNKDLKHHLGRIQFILCIFFREADPAAHHTVIQLREVEGGGGMSG